MIVVFHKHDYPLQEGHFRATTRPSTHSPLKNQGLTRSTLAHWQPTIQRNLRRLRSGVTGQPHLRNLDRWESLLNDSDLPGLHRVLTGLGRDCIEMREVSPMGGLLSDEERIRVLRSMR